MAKPKMPNINKDTIANALSGLLGGEGVGKGAYQAYMGAGNAEKINEALAKLVSGHAGRMGGQLDSGTVMELLRRGGANYALPGAGVGALTGFFAAPGQEEENLLGVKKYRAPTIGDRLMSALTYGAGGAAVGAGAGALMQRSMAKKLLESGASPDLVQSYMTQSGLMPNVEQTIMSTAQRGARGAAGAALGPNAVWRNPQDMANSLSALHSSVMTMAGERGMRDRNVIAGVTYLANATGLPIATIMKDPKAVSQAINRSAMANFQKFDEKSMGAMETVMDAIKKGVFAGEAPRTPGTWDYLRAAVKGPEALKDIKPGMLNRLQDWRGRGEGALSTDDFVRDLTRGDASNLAKQNLQVQGLDEKGLNKLVESLKQTGKVFDPNKGALPSQALTGRAYSNMLASDFDQGATSVLGKGALGLGLMGAGGLGAAAYMNRNQNNQVPDLNAQEVPRIKQNSARLSRADTHPLMQQLKALK